MNETTLWTVEEDVEGLTFRFTLVRFAGGGYQMTTTRQWGTIEQVLVTSDFRNLGDIAEILEVAFGEARKYALNKKIHALYPDMVRAARRAGMGEVDAHHYAGKVLPSRYA